MWGLSWMNRYKPNDHSQVNRQQNNVYVHTATLNSWSSDLLFEPMRRAGAEVRARLLGAAAARLAVPLGELAIAFQPSLPIQPKSGAAGWR